MDLETRNLSKTVFRHRTVIVILAILGVPKPVQIHGSGVPGPQILDPGSRGPGTPGPQI